MTCPKCCARLWKQTTEEIQPIGGKPIVVRIRVCRKCHLRVKTHEQIVMTYHAGGK